MQTCKRGHALTPDNVYIHSTHGRKSCRRCRNAPASERARRAGRHPRETLNSVSNAPLRERFIAMRSQGEITAATVAAAMGWYQGRRSDGRPRPDTVRVCRTLGVAAARDGGLDSARELTRRQTIKYETAVSLACALGMDPHEADV